MKKQKVQKIEFFYMNRGEYNVDVSRGKNKKRYTVRATGAAIDGLFYMSIQGKVKVSAHLTAFPLITYHRTRKVK